MNTDKLVKAIQIIVKEELKSVVPKLVREGVKKEMKSLLKENKQLREALKTQKPQQPTFMDEPVVENNSYTYQEKKQLSNNPVLNDILNETKGFNESSQTISFDSNMAPAGVGGMRAQMAAKLGYGDMGVGAQPTGVGIDTGNEIVNKALNRDYSQLMKAMDKKKQPFRPGV